MRRLRVKRGRPPALNKAICAVWLFSIALCVVFSLVGGPSVQSIFPADLPAAIDQPSRARTRTSATAAATSSSPKQKPRTKREDLVCEWEPGNDAACVDHLVKRIRETTRTSPGGISWQNSGSRWIFSGDSTVAIMYRLTLHKVLHGTPPCPDYSCRVLHAGNGVDVSRIFGFPKPDVWEKPNHSMGEGPKDRGLTNSSLQDCQSCDWDIFQCIPPESGRSSPSTYQTKHCNQTKGSTGGFVGVSFARDVEVQSTVHRTSQENLAKWLKEQWNTPALVQALDRPICVIATGMHDQAVPNITTAIYMQNMRDYLSLLAPQCSHLIWHGNNSPKSDNYPQKKKQTLEWNRGVLEILHAHYAHKSSFVDVYEASKTAGHQDNVHMRKRWYVSLGGMFKTVIETLPGEG